jgi:hypothetical protein
MRKKLYPETLPPETAKLIRKLQQVKPDFLNSFYLSGGTALSLQIGHRESIDLDFFNQEDFDPKLLQIELEKFEKLKNLQLDKNTLNAFLKGVQIQFLGYPYPLLRSTINWRGIKISSTLDIACTKLQTIGARGGKKDFIDLYFLLEKHSLENLFKQLEKKYPNSEFSQVHILKSLVYFKDADSQPMPRMHKKIEWKKVKKTIRDKVADFQF